MTGEAKKPGQHESIAHLWAQAAHDLRQPVQAALLLTSMLDGASGRTELRRTARCIGSALESLYDMLEVLTLLARIEAGQQTVQLRTCRLADALEPVIREVAEIAAKRGIPLRVRSMRGLVRSNPKLLATATRSLFLNAIKFGNGGEILARSRRHGDHLGLEIHFSGAPLDVASEKNAFVQLSPRNDRLVATELGLGLALLKHLCRRLGHGLQYTKLPPDRQLLTFMLPLPGASR